VAACRAKCPDGIVGLFGWRGLGESSYPDGRHLRAGEHDERVDIVKGRFMLFRRELLGRVPLALPRLGMAETPGFRCDDIALSLCIAQGEPGRHLVPAALAGRWVELPKGNAALEAQPEHYAIRDRSITALRRWLRTTEPVPVGAL
jgi:hypothetical protein